MNITLYYNYAENEILDKTKYLIKIADISGTLRNSTSIINPSITVNLNDAISNKLQSTFISIDWRDIRLHNDVYCSDGNTMLGRGYATVKNNNNVLNSNYIYIDEFNRYYYVDNIVSLGNNLWQLDLSVDVLMSYLEEIKNLKCIMTRNEFDYNELLPDRMLPILCSNTIETVEIDDSNISVHKKLRAYGKNIETDRCVLIQVANIKPIEENTPVTDTNSLNKTYVLTGKQFAQLVNGISSANGWSDFTWFFANPYDSLVSFKVIPFDLEYFIEESNRESVTKVLVGTQDVDTGGFQLKGVGNAYLIKENYKLTIPLGKFSYTPYNPKGYTPKFLSYQPYMNLQLFLPFYGFVDLDVNMLNDDGTINFLVEYIVDIVTGSCVALIKNSSNIVCYTYEFNISLEIPIGHSNYSNVITQQSLASLKVISALAGLGIGYGTSQQVISNNNGIPAKTGRQKLLKYVKQQNALAELEGSTSESLLNTVTNFTVDMVGASQSKVSGGNVSTGFIKGTNYMNPDSNILKPLLLIKKPDLVTVNPTDGLYNKDTYAHYYGRPNYKEVTLRECRGFTVIGACHMDGFRTATQSEINEIYKILTTGIRLPE